MIGLGLGLGLTLSNSGAGAAGGLPTFALAPETQALATRMTAVGSTMNAQKTYTADRWIRKLKAAGTWAKLSRLWIWGDTGPATCINWINPGTGDLTVVGAPTFTAPTVPYGAAPTANRGYNSSSISNYLDTGITLASVNRDNFSFGLYCENGTAYNPDAGCLDGSNGLLLTAKNASNGPATVRAFCASQMISSASKWDGIGLHTVSRGSSANFDAYHNPVLASTTAVASVASVSTSTITYLKANGFATASARPFQGGFFGTALTAADVDMIYRAMRSIIESNQFGDVYINEPGYAPQNVSAQVVVYGWTAQGVIAAYEAARQGKTVALVGGWRDLTVQALGGVSSNGLGATDLSNIAAIGGLPRVFYRRTNFIDGKADTSVTVRPRTASWIFRQMLDAARTGGLDIPLYAVGGTAAADSAISAIASIQKTGTLINSITTTDGRTFTGAQYIDATYEGDLMAMAGVSFTTGREAAGAGKEALNGWRGTLTGGGSNLHQFSKSPSSSPTLYNIDPYITPGVAGSGLIYGVAAKPAFTNGQADSQTQAYNFRLTFSDSGAKLVPFTTTPPTAYLASNYEGLGRLAAALTTAGTPMQIGDMLLNDSLGGNVYDFNNGGGMSTDLMGGASSYVAATTNAQRETIWKTHENWIRGLIYYALSEPDARMIATSARGQLAVYGWAADHYLDPHPNDQPYFPGQLYVREFRRMVNDLIWTGNDLAGTDGGTPRSTNTVSVASYPMDSHHGERFADTDNVPVRLWNEGCMFDSASGGVDLMAPLPFEIFVPRALECTNLSVTFCVAATHVAFGAIRMEATAMATAQALGMAAAVAIDKASTIQAAGTTFYATDLRPRLLASPSLTGEVAPVLPQVN
jgi:hypothetical protein